VSDPATVRPRGLADVAGAGAGPGAVTAHVPRVQAVPAAEEEARYCAPHRVAPGHPNEEQTNLFVVFPVLFSYTQRWPGAACGLSAVPGQSAGGGVPFGMKCAVGAEARVQPNAMSVSWNSPAASAVHHVPKNPRIVAPAGRLPPGRNRLFD
jgi:hypothetical protein